jgi:hypothetical protein
MARRKQHGGGRRGAGRPRKRPGKTPPSTPKPVELPWFVIREAAAAGATEAEILKAYRIEESALEDPATLARFRAELEGGLARYKIGLRMSIKDRGNRTRRGAGSVHALALQARNHLDFDKQIPAQEAEPDLGTARQRLEDLGEKMAAAASEREGKTVTLAMLLEREVRAVDKARADA